MNACEEVLSNWLDTMKWTIHDVDTPSANVKQVTIEDGTRYFLKSKKSLEEVKRELYLEPVLKQYNVPVAAPIISKKQLFYAIHGDTIYCLYEALSGNTASETFRTLEQPYAFGEAISRLHTGLANADPLQAFVKDMELFKQLKEWAIPESLQLDERVMPIDNYMRNHFFPILNELPRQIIHRDAHPANFLFDGDRLSGFLDFDLATLGPRIFDPLYCSTAILMNHFHHWKESMVWFDLLREIVKGYEDNIRLTLLEKKALFPMLLAIQLIFAAYFKKNDAGISRLNLEGALWLWDHQETIMSII
ncbi:phosphotransferase enzyme family protein [Paenibacillus senegalensis]|uniref:phosphotransferase enzyme family protein n=1 Tax=Paenibacillus senegalensis TaxID=1465766 RepID=UPI000288F68D|nr:phosphotransferase [Paenibacillus senegalensis]